MWRNIELMNQICKIMKRVFFVFVVAVLCCNTVSAQEDKNMFNHVAVGVNAGTSGVGIDVAVPIGDYLQLRAGYSMLPKLKLDTTLDLTPEAGSLNQVPGLNISEVDVEGRLNIANAKVLADIFPFKKSSFHLTVGAYFGNDKIVDVENSSATSQLQLVHAWNTANPTYRVGLELGDYLLTPDAQGHVDANLQTAKVKPYVGLGFGRAVPKKRLGFMFELGTMFWGSPKVFLNGNDHELTANDLGEDGGDILNKLSKFTIYPVMNFRLCCRIL